MKLLNNKFFILGAALALVASILIIPQLLSSESKKTDADIGQGCDSKKKPRYCAAKADVEKMGNAPWSITEYRIAAGNLDAYYQRKDISASEYEELKTYMHVKYLGVLGGAIRSYCQSITTYEAAKLLEFESELTTIPGNDKTKTLKSSLLTIIIGFKNAYNLPDRVSRYITTSQFNRSVSANYQSIINHTRSSDILKINSTLKAKMNECEQMLSSFKNVYDSKIEVALTNGIKGDKEAADRICTIMPGKVNRYYSKQLTKDE